MAKTSGEYEQEFLQTIKATTGNTLTEWIDILKLLGFSKQNETLNWLKKEHKMNHLQASLLAGIFLNNGKPVYMNEDNLLENQFAKSEAMRKLFNATAEKILQAFPGTQMIAKKTYVSFTAKREFAAINIRPKELRIGMDLGGEAFSSYIQKSKLTGPMPRISHMVVIADQEELSEKLIAYLEQSYSRVN